MVRRCPIANTIDERKRTSGSTLQAMIGMGLPKDIISVILGKDLSAVYRELNWNSSEGITMSDEGGFEELRGSFFIKGAKGA